MKIEVKERPEIGFFLYIRGEKPRFSVGDTLASYNHENCAEDEFGIIIAVRLDEEFDDWLYTFKDELGEVEEYEEHLVDDHVYKK